MGLDKPEINVVELIALIEKECKIQVPYELVEPEDVYTDEPLRRCPDITKARNKLEYNPNISLEVGLKVFFDWALSNYTGQTPK